MSLLAVEVEAIHFVELASRHLTDFFQLLFYSTSYIHPESLNTGYHYYNFPSLTETDSIQLSHNIPVLHQN
ncbi:Uncharacterised protein [Streptococcus pneumoniae]|nr:Uncharacterised protein [Streptococcus pneumoniae]